MASSTLKCFVTLTNGSDIVSLTPDQAGNNGVSLAAPNVIEDMQLVAQDPINATRFVKGSLSTTTLQLQEPWAGQTLTGVAVRISTSGAAVANLTQAVRDLINTKAAEGTALTTAVTQAQASAEAAAVSAGSIGTQLDNLGIQVGDAQAAAVLSADKAEIATDKALEAVTAATTAGEAAAQVQAIETDIHTNWQVKLDSADASAATAVAAAGAAGVSTAGAAASALAAQSSKTQAESARDAALIQSGVYATEALGRAAVADGGAFKVQGSGDVAAYEYRRTDSTISVLIATYPSAAAVVAKLDGELSKNLFNPAATDVAPGYFPVHTTGSLSANSAYNCTGFIPVVAGQAYTVSSKHYWVWYNASKGFISGTSDSDGNPTQTAPANAAFMRTSVVVSGWSVFQVELGIVKTFYEPYGRYLPPAAIRTRSVTEAHVAFGTLTKELTDFLKTGKNLFNKATVVIGQFLGNDNSVGVLSTLDYSAFIKVTPGQSYKSNYNMRFTTFFRGDKTFVAGGSENVNELVVPSGVEWIRITITHVNLGAFQLEAGATVTAYEHFGLKVEGPSGESLIFSIEEIDLAEGAVTPEKTNFFVPAKNLFNKNAVTVGYFLGHDNSVSASATFDYSNYIAVVPGQSYKSNNGMRFTTFYDAGKVFVAGGSSAETTAIVVPAGVYFVRITIFHNKLESFQLELGTTVTAFEEFGFYLQLATGEKIITQQSSSAPGWSNKTWATLGDSITAGATFQPVVVASLGLVFTNYGSGGAKISGLVGDTTAMCQDTRINAIPATMDLVTVMGGTNDWAQNIALGTVNSTDPATFNGALNTLISKLSTRFAGKRIALCTTPYGELYGRLSDGSGWANAYTNTLGLTTIDYAEAVRLACKRWGIPCIDIASKVGWNTVNIRTYIGDDGGLVHPNSVGGTRMAEVIVGDLKSIAPL